MGSTYQIDKSTPTGKRLTLAGQAQNWQRGRRRWPTPKSSDASRGARKKPRAAKSGVALIEAASWFHGSRRGASNPIGRTDTAICRFLPQDQNLRNGIAYSSPIRTLNPLFVDFLMGLPVGWTDCGSAVTEWSHFKQRLLTALFSQLSLSILDGDDR
jgi:DNA (cytosine-5)-methyltransferase 1